MSKPSKEVIELAEKLHMLDVRKEPEVGDWYFWEREYLFWGYEDSEIREHIPEDAVVIPPLEWCLEWIFDQGRSVCLYDEASEDESYSNQGYDWVLNTTDINNGVLELGDTPHLAVLKAMVAVKEAGND